MSLEELWTKLKNGESHSLLKKYLTEDVYKKLKDVKTKLGGTLADCIRSGNIVLTFIIRALDPTKVTY